MVSNYQVDVCSEEFDIFMEWFVHQVQDTDDITPEFVDSIYPDWKEWYINKNKGIDSVPPMCIPPLEPITVYL